MLKYALGFLTTFTILLNNVSPVSAQGKVYVPPLNESEENLCLFPESVCKSDNKVLIEKCQMKELCSEFYDNFDTTQFEKDLETITGHKPSANPYQVSDVVPPFLDSYKECILEMLSVCGKDIYSDNYPEIEKCFSNNKKRFKEKGCKVQ